MNTLIKLLALVSIANCLQAQGYYSGDTLFVNSINGLNLRDKPSLKGEKIGLLKYGDAIVVHEEEAKEKAVEIGGFAGNWVQVTNGQLRGYAYDAYLSSMPVIAETAEETSGCFIRALTNYLRTNFEAIDTAKYCNGTHGESAHRMTIVDFEQRHQYIYHTYWESYCYEYQISGMRSCEGVQLVKNALSVCGIPFGDLGKLNLQGHYIGYFPVPAAEFCCSVSIHKSDERIIIKIYGGP